MYWADGDEPPWTAGGTMGLERGFTGVGDGGSKIGRYFSVYRVLFRGEVAF